jgi:glucosylceramidase
MESFSLDADRAHMLPFIKAAVTTNPSLHLHASPWSPPAWMKQTDDMCQGGALKEGPEIRTAIARFLACYVEAMDEEGITVSRVMLQNEMDVTSNYPSCPYDPVDFAEIYRDHLKPEFDRRGLTTEIWGGTYRSCSGLQAFESLAVEGFRESITGIGLQYARAEVLQALQANYPDLPLMHTESVCHNGDNSWELAVALFYDFIGYMRNGCDSYSYWNTILPEDALSGWGWKQNSLVTVDRPSGTFKLNPDYQVMRWLSTNIPPGSTRVEAFSFQRSVIGFRRPDGSHVALVFNPSDKAVTVNLHVESKTHITEAGPLSFVAVEA